MAFFCAVRLPLQCLRHSASLFLSLPGRACPLLLFRSRPTTIRRRVQTKSNLRYWLLCDYTCDLIYLLDLLIVKPRLTFMHDGVTVVGRIPNIFICLRKKCHCFVLFVLFSEASIGNAKALHAKRRVQAGSARADAAGSADVLPDRANLRLALLSPVEGISFFDPIF